MERNALGKDTLPSPLIATEEYQRLVDFFALLLEWDIADKKNVVWHGVENER